MANQLAILTEPSATATHPIFRRPGAALGARLDQVLGEKVVRLELNLTLDHFRVIAIQPVLLAAKQFDQAEPRMFRGRVIARWKCSESRL